MYSNHVPRCNGLDRLHTDSERNTVSHATQTERKLEAKQDLVQEEESTSSDIFQATMKEEKLDETSHKGVKLGDKDFWAVIAIFMITCLYSAMSLMMNLMAGGIPLGEPEVSFSDGTATISLPFSINNTGLYDISDLNITTCIADYNRTLISTSTTIVPLIAHGSCIEEVHNISISLDKIVSKNTTYLLFNSGNFSIEIFAGLKLRTSFLSRYQ